MSCCAVDTLGGVPVGAPDPSPLALLKEHWDFTMFDETTTGWIGIVANGAVVAASAVGSDSRHPGVINMRLATNATSRATYRRANAWAETDDGILEIESIFRIITAVPDPATAGENYTIAMLGGDTNLLPFNDGMSFILDDSLGSLNWFARTDSTAGGVTDIDTLVAPDLDWHRYRVRCNVDASSVEFFIDEVSVAITALTIPGVAEMFGDVVVMEREAVIGAGILDFHLDYWAHLKEINPPRP